MSNAKKNFRASIKFVLGRAISPIFEAIVLVFFFFVDETNFEGRCFKEKEIVLKERKNV